MCRRRSIANGFFKHLSGKTDVGVVLAKREAILGSGGEHAVWHPVMSSVRRVRHE